MNQVVADTSGAALLPFACDTVTDPAEASQLFHVDMDQVTRRLALVALDRRLGLQVALPPQSQAVQGSGHGGEGSRLQPADMAQVQPLMAQLDGVLEAIWIERPPLAAANTSSIRPCGYATCTVPGQPFVGTG